MKNLVLRRLCIGLSLSAAAVYLPTVPAMAQVDRIESLRTEEPTRADLLDDFIHYVLIARPDLAEGSARALLESGITDAELYIMVRDEIDTDRFEDALLRAMRMDALAEIAGDLETHILQGRRDVARDPDEIARNIQLLLGNARAKMMAREALDSAGEYAVPQLLDVLAKPGRQALKTEARLVLIDIGRQAVTPLCVALPQLDPVAQERVCQILGEIDYKHALPTLWDVANNASAQPAVREAARRAYERIGGVSGANPEDLWLGLAEEYWAEAQSLFAWPGEPTANVWSYDHQLGLIATAVPTEIYAEVMAMRCANEALTSNRNSLDALSMWVAANFRRSDQLGAKTDPTRPQDQRQPLFYGVMAGPDVGQRVLARSIRDLNTQLARHAIASLNVTAGGSSLWSQEGRSTPLIEALTFPERRVRYDAALALGHALPRDLFTGSERVVPTLANAIQTGGERFAAVIAQDPEDQRTIAANLRGLGFSVLPPRASYAELQNDLLGTVGVDLFMVMLPVEDLRTTVSLIQGDPRVAASPIMLMVPTSLLGNVEPLVESDRRVTAMRLGLNEAQRTAAIMAHVEANMGSLITNEEADQYAADALTTLRDIAVSNTRAFDVAQAAPALIEALKSFDGDLQLTAAQTLSWVDTADAQQALLSAALSESNDLRKIAMLSYTSDSARRFGSMANDAQIRRLIQLVRDATGPVATAAATTHGALNLPASNLVDFIVD